MDDTKDLELALLEIQKAGMYSLIIILLWILFLVEFILLSTETINIGIFTSLVFVNVIVYYFFKHKKNKIMSNVQSILDKNV